MTETQRKAMMDAIAGLLGKRPEPPDGPQNPFSMPQEFADAWNKIMAKYDNDDTSIADLQDLLQKIQDGSLKVIDD